MKKILVLISFISFSLFSCKDNDEIHNENELITTVKLTFSENGNTSSFSFTDKDGEGGKPPVIDNISLKPNVTYALSVEFIDESKTPSVNLTSEISEEGAEHLLVFTPQPLNLGVYTYSDKDVNGFPIGLKGSLKTSSVASGTLKVQLRHQPPINGKRTKDGTPGPGSDDVNIDFPIVLK